MNRIPTLFLLILTALLLGSSGYGQAGICLDFESFQVGQRLGKETGQAAGSVILEQEDITVSLERFRYPNGTTGFENVLVMHDSLLNPQAPSTLLFPSNINLNFDFSQLPAPVESLCLDYFYWGGDINIVLNGGDTLIFSDLESFVALDGEEIAPGVKAEFLFSSNTRAQGTLCLFGPIEHLLIGGQEFGLDNLCVYVESLGEPCTIQNLVAEPHPCTPNDIFYVDVEFDVSTGQTSGEYQVLINNQVFGPFPAPDSFLTVGPVETYGDETFQVTVFDLDYPDCKASTRFQQVCAPECPVEDIRVYVEYCPEDMLSPTARIKVETETDLNISHARIRFFQGIAGELLNTEWQDVQEALVLPPNLDLSRSLTFEICFTLPNGQKCCVEGEVILIPCERDQCIDFERVGPDTIFSLEDYAPGDKIFSEDGVPVSIHELIWDDGSEASYGKIYISEELISNFPQAKRNYAFTTGATMQFNFFELDRPVRSVCLDFADFGGSKNLLINDTEILVGNSLRELAEKEIPGVQIEVSGTDPTTSSRFGTLCIKGEIRTLRIGGGEFGIDNVCFETGSTNPDCIISDLAAEAGECLDNGTFFADIKFAWRNPGQKGYEVLTLDGRELGSYTYDEPFPQVGPFRGDNTRKGLIVRDKEFPACADTIYLPAKECPVVCPIVDIKGEVLRCDSNGLSYDVLLEVAYRRGYEGTAYYVVVENERYGPFEQPQVRIPNVKVYTEATFFVLQVCPVRVTTEATETCCLRTEIKKDCPAPCPLEGIEGQVLNCHPDGSYDVWLKVDYAEGQEGQAYYVVVENERYGPFDEAQVKIPNAQVYTDALSFTLTACPLSSSGLASENCCVRTEIKKDCPDTPADCISFDEQPTQSYGPPDFQPGDEVFETSGVAVKIFSLQNLDWSSSFGKFSVLPRDDLPDFQAADGQLLYQQDISSIFDFTSYPDPVEKVSIDYHFTGNLINLAANGGQIQIHSMLAPGYHQLGNGVELEVIYQSNDGSQGKLVFYGNIQTLLIGGDILALDNLCLNEPKPCRIGELVLEPGPCQNDGSFYLSLDFEYAHTSRYFVVEENGQGIAKYAYEELPVKLGPLRTPYEAGSVFRVYDANDQTCGSEATFGPYFCPQKCEIREVKVYDIECDYEKQAYHMTVAIDGVNLGEVLTLKTRGGYIMRFKYKGEPFRIPNVPLNNLGKDGFTICGGLQPNDAFGCCYEVEYELPCQTECNISAVEPFDFECFPDGTYSVSLKIEAQNTSGHYYIKTLSGQEFEVPAPDGIVRLDHIPWVTAAFSDLLVICDQENRDCCFEVRYDIPCFMPCGLTGVQVGDITCNDDGTYNLSLKIEGQDYALSDYLYLRTKSGFEKRFLWTGEAVRIEGIPNMGWGEDGLEVCLPNRPDCCVQASYEVPCPLPEECRIGEMDAVATPCADDGSYFLEIDFRHENTSGGFTLWIDGREYDQYRYEELPLRVGPFYPGIVPIDHHEIRVKDLEKNCGAETKVAPCQAQGCQFTAVVVEPVKCDDGEFYAEVKYRVNDPNGSGFLIFAEGELFGPYSYDSDEQILIGPFAADGVSSYDFLFVDLDDPSCYGYLELDPVECSKLCSILDPVVEIVDCNDDGSYRVKIDFDHRGAENDFFDIYSTNGEILGTYRLASLPVQVDLPLDPNESHLKICINDQTDCCARAEILWRPCPTPCGVSEAEVVTTRCDGDSYFARIKADWNLNNLDQYIITQGDIAYPIQGADEDGLVTIGPFRSHDSLSYQLTITDLRNGCVVDFTVGPVSCSESDDVWPGDANLDNIANHFDLISLGLAWGKQGPARTESNTNWAPTPAPLWGERFSTGPDFKHADCNGDGIVDERDIDIIRRNYGRRHGDLKEAPALPGTDFDPPIFFDLPEGGPDLPDTSYFRIPIVLGTEEQPLSNIYGVAFTIEFDPAVINPNDVEIVYPASWLGEPGVNLQSLDYTYLGEGKIEIALTRTDRNEVSGFGPVAYFRGIRDDIVGRHEAEVDINRSHATDASQNLIKLQGLKSLAKFHQPEPPVRNYGLIDLKNGMRVFPNPAQDRVFVDNLFQVPVDALQILTTDGRPVGGIHHQVNELDVSRLPQGLYILRIEMGGYQIHHKLFKQ